MIIHYVIFKRNGEIEYTHECASELEATEIYNAWVDGEDNPLFPDDCEGMTAVTGYKVFPDYGMTNGRRRSLVSGRYKPSGINY